jgi:pimeloyl-ACP methyl ester carboxylesterase
MSTDWTTGSPGAGAYADVNGINLYYETHGSGRPLVLLHGGLGSGVMLGPIVPRLAEHHQVIAVDLQGHGRTADVDRPITLETMGDDIGALIGHLGVGRPDLMGYSLGGGVAFQVALRHPGLVRKLVLVSTYLRKDAAYQAIGEQQQQLSGAAAPMLRETPMYELYARVAPRPDDFPRLLDKMGAWMAEDFDYTDQFRAIQVPTLYVAADADMFPPSHAVEAFELLGGGQRDGGWMGEGRPAGGHALAILPGLQHYNIFASPLLAEVALAFLDAPEG